MEVLFVLIPVSIALAAASLVACLFAIRGGQYDDLESPPWRILFDDRRGARAMQDAATKLDLDQLLTKREDEHTGAQAQRSTPL